MSITSKTMITIILLSAIMASCGLEPVPADPIEDNTCIDYTLDLSSLPERWADTYELAISTSRINLAGTISDLQELRREGSSLIEASCSEPIDSQDKFLNMANSGIDMLLAFSANESTGELQILYVIRRDIYVDSLSALKNKQVTVPRRAHYFATGTTGFHIEYYGQNQEFVESERITRDDVSAIRTEIIGNDGIAIINIFDADQDFGTLQCSAFIDGINVDTQTGRGKDGVTCTSE